MSKDSDQSVVSFEEERGNDVSMAGEGESERRTGKQFLNIQYNNLIVRRI